MVVRRQLSTKALELIKDAASGKLRNHLKLMEVNLQVRSESLELVAHCHTGPDQHSDTVIFRGRTPHEFQTKVQEAFAIYLYMRDYYRANPDLADRRVWRRG